MSLNSQNNYKERLAEKLKRQVEKRGTDSPHAEELKHAGGDTAKNATKSAPEKKADAVKE